jgi:hypothetical protein
VGKRDAGGRVSLSDRGARSDSISLGDIRQAGIRGAPQ